MHRRGSALFHWDQSQLHGGGMGCCLDVLRSGCLLSRYRDQCCFFDRAVDIVALGRVRSHVAQRRGLALWPRGTSQFARGWWMIGIRHRRGGQRGWSQRCLVGRFGFV